MRLHTILLLLGLALPNTTASALDAVKTSAITKGAATFATLASDSANSGRPPRQSDAAVKGILDLVFDTSELKNGPAQPRSALDNLNAWQLAVLKIGLIYTLSGTGVTDIAAVPNTPAVVEKINRNTVEFAPEMGRYCDAVLWVQGAIMDTVAAFLLTASPTELDRPNIKSGIAKIRGGNSQTIDGVITTLPIDGLTDAWRRDRATVLTAIAPKAAKFLLPDQLRALRERATDVASQMIDQDVKTGLLSFAGSIERR